jgi:uncharacterized membrane protein YgcG
MQGKERFLSQARAIASEPHAVQPIPKTPFERLKKWIYSISHTESRKERFSMLSTIGTILVILTLAFGGTGATVYASQGSLPDDFLYPVMTASEQAQLAMTANMQTRLELLLRFSERRIDEVVATAGQGLPGAEAAAVRLQEQMNLALQAASQLGDPAMTQALRRVQQHLTLQEQRLQAAQNGLGTPDTPILERTRQMIRLQLRLVEDGLADPAAFRHRYQQKRAAETSEPSPEPPAETQVPFGAGYGPGDGTPECPLCTPALDGSGPGPGPNFGGGTPQPDAGYGPGPGVTPACETCTPALDGSGPGPGPQAQDGTTEPGENSNDGSGPSDSSQGSSGTQESGGNDQESGQSDNPPADTGSGGNGGNDNDQSGGNDNQNGGEGDGGSGGSGSGQP